MKRALLILAPLAACDGTATPVIQGSVTVLRGPSFERHDYPAMCARHVDVGDLDGDGRLDMVTAGGCSLDAAITVMLASADFEPVLYAGGYASALALGDIDGDGLLDVVASTSTGVALYRNTGGGELAAPVTFAGGMREGLALGDFDGDGRLDAAVPTFDSVGVLLNTGGAFAAPITVATNRTCPPFRLLAADLDGDAHPDLVTTDFAVGFGGSCGNTVTSVLSRGNGVFGDATSWDVGDFPTATIARDVDGDGHLDLVVRHITGIAYLHKQDDGSFAVRADVDITHGAYLGLGAGHCISADCPVYAVDAEHLWRTQLADPQPTGEIVADHLLSPWSMRVVDLDGDGTDDVLLANEGEDGSVY